jgi:hypothetical protein
MAQKYALRQPDQYCAQNAEALVSLPRPETRFSPEVA